MTWKTALFLGGAVVLLAACDNATAPQPQLRTMHGAAAASGKTTFDPSATTLSTSCKSGYSVSSGNSDSTSTCGVY